MSLLFTATCVVLRGISYRALYCVPYWVNELPQPQLRVACGF